MGFRASMGWVVAAVMVLAFGAVSPVQAQTATFSEIDDAVPGKYFDAATTAPDPLNPNRLIVGFNAGRDPQTWTSREFTASTEAFFRPSAMDTLSFVIDAPDGQYISRVSYKQVGTGSIARTGKASGGSQWVVDGEAADLGLFGTNPTLSSTVDLTGQNKTRVPVSITTGLFVFSTPQLGSATLKVTGAEIIVELRPR
jgi:hypothetical protein